MFQSTPARGAGDTPSAARHGDRACFNPHPPGGAGDCAASCTAMASCIVSIHTRPGGRVTVRRTRDAYRERCFNPHPPGGAGDCYMYKYSKNMKLGKRSSRTRRIERQKAIAQVTASLYVLVNEPLTAIANLPGKCRALGVRGGVSKRAEALADRTPAWPQSARHASASACRDSRTAGCPSPGRPCPMSLRFNSTHWAGSIRHSKTEFCTRWPRFSQILATCRSRLWPSGVSVFTS